MCFSSQQKSYCKMWRVGEKNIYSEKLAENLMTFQGRDSRDKHKISRVPWRIGAHTKKIACIRTEILSILLYIASHSPFFKHTFTLTADYHARGLVCPSGAIWGLLHKDTLTYGQEEIEPPTLWSVDNLLCLLSHSCPEETWFPWSLETQRMHLLISFVEWYQMKQLI